MARPERLLLLKLFASTTLAFAATGCSEALIYAGYHVDLGGTAYPSSALFAAGDPYHLVVSSSSGSDYSWAYVLRKEEDGTYRTIFPDVSINGGSPLFLPNSSLILPAGKPPEFPQRTGVVEYVIILSTHTDPDLILFTQAPIRAKRVVEDILERFKAKATTKTEVAPERLDVRVGTNSSKQAESIKEFRGDWFLASSGSDVLGAVIHVRLRHEIR